MVVSSISSTDSQLSPKLATLVSRFWDINNDGSVVSYSLDSMLEEGTRWLVEGLFLFYSGPLHLSGVP
jgi:hypothetical protein